MLRDLGTDFALCSHDINTHGRCYRYDPAEDRVSLVCDLGQATGEAGRRTLPQGKSHNPFYELYGKLYLSTHYPLMSQTQAVGSDGRLYAAPWIEKPSRAVGDPLGHQCDLISYPDPLGPPIPGPGQG